MRPPVWLAPDWLSERAAGSVRAVKSQDVVICRSILGQHRPLEKPAGNGSHRDVLYVEELIGPETVNTMPEETIRAFQDHGKVAHTLEHDSPKCANCSPTSNELGYDDVVSTLEREGVEKFSESSYACSRRSEGSEPNSPPPESRYEHVREGALKPSPETCPQGETGRC